MSRLVFDSPCPCVRMVQRKNIWLTSRGREFDSLCGYALKEVKQMIKFRIFLKDMKDFYEFVHIASSI